MNQQELTWQPGMTLEQLEKYAIIKAYAFYQENKSMTAQSLGISIRTLDNKFEKYAAEKAESERVQDERRKQGEELQRLARGPAQDGPEISSTQNGFSMESVAGFSAQPSLPMQERNQVQEMPLPKTSGSDSRKSRR